MPHLSPMSWIYTLLAIWLILFSLATSMYFYMPPRFLSPTFFYSSLNQSAWHWTLQGGRAKQ